MDAELGDEILAICSRQVPWRVSVQHETLEAIRSLAQAFGGGS